MMTTPSEEEARAAAKEVLAELDDSNTISRDKNERAARAIRMLLAALASRVSTPPADAHLARIVEAITKQRPWFTEKADEVLARIKTDTTEDVMLYHDAVSVLVAARTMYDLVATLAVSTPPSETGLCDYTERGTVCTRLRRHEGDHLLAADSRVDEARRFTAEDRATLVEFAASRIQSVWDDVGETDALTLAQNVVAAQEFAWLSMHFPIQRPVPAVPVLPTEPEEKR